VSRQAYGWTLLALWLASTLVSFALPVVGIFGALHFSDYREAWVVAMAVQLTSVVGIRS
jgi:hypothetical protein